MNTDLATSTLKVGLENGNLSLKTPESTYTVGSIGDWNA
jgi:hypothetical protein